MKMRLSITKRFQKDLKNIDQSIKTDVLSILKNMESAHDFSQLRNLKKIKGQKHHYRIRIGNYRLGFRVIGNDLKLERLMHRRDIYKYFP